MPTIWHQSGVNPQGEPFVQLLLDDRPIAQFTPEEARDHAKNILEATEACEQDAFLFAFFQKEVGLDVNRAMHVIVDFRKWREARGKKGPPSDRSEWVIHPDDMDLSRLLEQTRLQCWALKPALPRSDL